MKPRGYLGTFAVLAAKMAIVSFVGIVIVFFLIGLAGTLAGEGPFSEWLGIIAYASAVAVPLSVCFGLLFGLLAASNYKASTISISFANKDVFITQLKAAMATIGFHPESQNHNTLSYKPSGFREKIMSPRISVQIEQNSATIVGPAQSIKRLKKSIWRP